RHCRVPDVAQGETACEAVATRGKRLARDGRGVDVGNGGAGAIEAVGLLREGWLAFGKRLPDIVAAAEKEERCALLPLMSANRLLSLNSPASFDTAKRQFAQANKLAATVNAREKAWFAGTEDWFAGDRERDQKIDE